MRCDLKLRLLLSGGWETILSSGSHLGREITFSLNLHLTDPSVPGPELTSVHGHRQSWEMDFLSLLACVDARAQASQICGHRSGMLRVGTRPNLLRPSPVFIPCCARFRALEYYNINWGLDGHPHYDLRLSLYFLKRENKSCEGGCLKAKGSECCRECTKPCGNPRGRISSG